MREHLLAELEDELIENKVHLGLDFVVQEPGFQMVKSTVCRIIVDVQRV
jgi:hypothetical protein